MDIQLYAYLTVIQLSARIGFVESVSKVCFNLLCISCCKTVKSASEFLRVTCDFIEQNLGYFYLDCNTVPDFVGILLGS